MYSGSSEQYWKNKSKPNPLKSTRSKLILLLLALVLFSGLQFKSNSLKRIEERQRHLREFKLRPVATEHHYKLCETNMRDVLRMQCDEMCSTEAMSIPRPTMYQSCHHGCSRSFYSAAVVGCRQGSEENAFHKMNSESHISCSRYIDIDPRPDVQSTCKKYYRQATKRGRQIGFDFIEQIIDIEWDKKKKRLQDLL
jgi:hypothetical protein